MTTSESPELRAHEYVFRESRCSEEYLKELCRWDIGLNHWRIHRSEKIIGRLSDLHWWADLEARMSLLLRDIGIASHAPHASLLESCIAAMIGAYSLPVRIA